MELMFFAEVLSHISFFIVFLTIFYVTYVGYIQQQSMITEFSSLLKESFQFLVILFPPQLLQFFQDVLYMSTGFVDPVLDKLVKQETGQNAQVLTPVYIGVFTAATIGILLSSFLTYLAGHSIIELLYTNLISLSFVAITDFIIVALYGQFRLLDTQYLSGLFSVKAAGGNLNCNVGEDTLDSMFTIPWIQSIIHTFLKSQGL